MDKKQREETQKLYTDKMVQHLPLLRASAQLTQNQLAKKLGVTRPTIVAIESERRPLQWYMYLAMVLVFMQEDVSRKLIESLELFDESLINDVN